MKLPRSEQETIVIYDVEVGKWHIDTTYPTHIRKYAELLGEIEEKTEDRLAGWIDEQYSSSFSVKKRRKLTDEQRREYGERLKRSRGL